MPSIVRICETVRSVSFAVIPEAFPFMVREGAWASIALVTAFVPMAVTVAPAEVLTSPENPGIRAAPTVPPERLLAFRASAASATREAVRDTTDAERETTEPESEAKEAETTVNWAPSETTDPDREAKDAERAENDPERLTNELDNEVNCPLREMTDPERDTTDAESEVTEPEMAARFVTVTTPDETVRSPLMPSTRVCVSFQSSAWI